MAIPSTSTNSSGDANEPEKVLADWLNATSEFYIMYQRLVVLIDQRNQPYRIDYAGAPYLGQCPVDSLLNLVLVMQAELEKLVHEMDQLDEFRKTTVNQHIRRFIDHTRRLNQLNRRARIRIDLASTPSS